MNWKKREKCENNKGLYLLIKSLNAKKKRNATLISDIVKKVTN